jgi:type VI secretion system protein ImpL
MTPTFALGLVIGLALSLLTVAGVAALLRQLQQWRLARLEQNPEESREQQRLAQGAESFKASLRRLDAATGGRGQRYRVPWCLVVGAENSGRRTLLAHSGTQRPFGAPGPEELRQEGRISFWLRDRGVMVLPPAVEAPEAHWNALLRKLRGTRAQRPVDSVLLTISCADLVGPAALGPEAARRKVDALYQALRRVHRVLGMRVPVYVLVTRCDVLPGFQGFCRALPRRYRDEMLGWSSPYAFETPYATGWVEEALETLHRDLCVAQTEALALGRGGPRERGDLLLLPAGLGMLAEPLRRFLDPLFLPGDYHEPILLRGLYFCGDPDGPATSVEAAEPKSPRHPAFVNHLLDQKIFPERGLAQPAAGSRTANHRALRTLQGALAVCVLLAPLALWSAVDSLRESLPPVTRTLQSLAELEGELRVARGSRQMVELEDEELERYAEATLLGMSRIQVARLAHPLLPTSWLSSVDGDVRDAMRTAFEDVVLSSFHASLQHSRDNLLGRGKVLAEQAGGLLGPARAPELQTLRSLDTDLNRLTRRLETYNGIRTVEPAQKLERVAWLAGDLFGLSLPGFTQDATLYVGALDNARYEQVEAPTPEQGVNWARELTGRFRRRLMLENPLERDLKELAEAISALKAGGQSGDNGVRAVRKVAVALKRTREEAEHPDAAWLADEVLGEPLPSMLAAIRASSLLGEQAARDTQSRWQSDFQSLRERLFQAEAPGLGRLLLVEKGKLVMAPRAVALQSLLEGFLVQPYVQAEHGEPLVRAPVEGPVRVLWDREGLAQALELVPAYESFLRKDLEKAPAELRGLLGGLAREQLERTLRERVARARRVEPLPANPVGLEGVRAGLASEVASLGRVSAPLRQLLDTYERLELSESSLELRGQLATETEALLRRVDALLESDRLYVPDARLAEWHGAHPAALEAFAVTDGEALAEYLKTQRSRVEELSREYAATPVALLEAVSAGRPTPPLLSKWQRIAAELRQRELLVPGNSVQVLETFVQSDMMKMVGDGCVGRLAPRRGDSTDFFLSRREALIQVLRQRCEGISTDEVVEGYQALASRFNQTLAGRYPFTSRGTSDPEQDASPRELRDFLRALDAYQPVLDRYLARSREDRARLLGPAGPDILAFLARMKTLRSFFAPLMTDDAAEPAPAFAVSVKYRVNRRAERWAHGIIEWRLEVGDELVDGSFRRWSLGDPIRVSLRWAKDGPFTPARSGQFRGVRVGTDGTAVFEYGGPWALVRLLREHGLRREMLERGADPRAASLGFLVALEPRERAEARGSSRIEARAFLRVLVFPPDSQVPLSVPREWPTRAPVLPGTGAAPPSSPAPESPTAPIRRTQESPP